MAKSLQWMLAEIQSGLPEWSESTNEQRAIPVLHVAMEYGQPGLPGSLAIGGIGSVVASLCLAQQAHYQTINARVILPYYGACPPEVIANAELVQEIQHDYDGRKVSSQILKKTNSEGVIQYFVKSLDPAGIALFQNLLIPEMIYSDGWSGTRFIERMAYFSSAVAKFACVGEPAFKPQIVQSHGWALAFLGQLIRKQRNENQSTTPKTIYVTHSIHDGDGIYRREEIPNIGLDHPPRVSLTQIIFNQGYDYIVYVSEQLLLESLTHGNPDISHLISKAYHAGKTSVIKNNVFASHFDPSRCLPDELKIDLNQISQGKQKLKQFLNNTIFKVQKKSIHLHKPLLLYVGRFSEEKGIEKFDSAIQVMLRNEGTFIAMGTGVPYLISAFEAKYQHEPRVIFLTQKEDQKEYGAVIRAAADIYLVPSKIETCGLVPMEGNLAGAMTLASRIGGLPDIVTPDNGALFEYEHNFEEILQKLLDRYQKLKDQGHLDATLRTIQQNAIDTFDWNSSTVGSGKAYNELYKNLIKPAPKRKRSEALPSEIVQIETPDRLAKRKKSETPALEESAQQAIYKKKRIVLQVCLEYKQIQFGGVGISVTSLVEALNQTEPHDIECRVTTPHYPWHDALIAQNLIFPRKTYQIRHMYRRQLITSTVTKINNYGVVQYLVKPNDEKFYHQLYGEITVNESNAIFHQLTPKVAYFNSAVSAFIAQELNAHIIMLHGWACALIPRLLKERDNTHDIKTIQIVHGELTEQGVTLCNEPDFKALTGIGLNFGNKTYISPLKEGIAYADKTVFVSKTLLKQSLQYQGFFHFYDLMQQYYQNGRLYGILNGINKHFDPEKLGLRFLDKTGHSLISEQKCAAKYQLIHMIDFSQKSPTIPPEEKTIFQAKHPNPEKIWTWTLFIGRFSPEKGIDRLEEAIKITLNNNGVFVIMGLYNDGPEDQMVKDLAEKYQDNPNVIVIHEKNAEIQKKYGPLLRYAADITFLPSHKEAAGLVSLEGQLNSSFIVSSDVGGLNDSVIPFETGLKYQEHNPTSQTSLSATLNEANTFLTTLKNQPELHETFLRNLYHRSQVKYLFSSPEGPTQEYRAILDSLCQFECEQKTIVHRISNTRFKQKA